MRVMVESDVVREAPGAFSVTIRAVAALLSIIKTTEV